MSQDRSLKVIANSLYSHLVFIALISGAAIFLLWVANLLPHEHLKNQLRDSVVHGGFTSCELSLSLSVPQDRSLTSALAPESIEFSKDDPCLKLTYINLAEHEAKSDIALRHQYLWGLRALYASAASVVAEPRLEQLLEYVTYAAILLLALTFFLTNRVHTVFLTPIFLSGLLFSGVSSITESPLAFCFLWAWLAPTLFLLTRNRINEHKLLIFIGATSAYIWFLEGHFIVLVSLIMLAKLATLPTNLGVRRTVSETLCSAGWLHFGFASLYLTIMVVKLALFGSTEVLGDFSSAAINRSSSLAQSGEEVRLEGLIRRLLFVGFQWTSTYKHVLLWKFLVVSTGLLFIFSVTTATFYWKKLESSRKSLILVLMILSLYCAIRLLILPNHSYVHARMMSRYLGFPMAAVWSASIVLIFSLRSSRLLKQTS